MIISCSQSKPSSDYFGQPLPDSIPTIFAPDIISVKGRLEHGISFSPNSSELAFGILNKQNLNGEIYYSKKNKGKWTVPELFKPLIDKSAYLPYFSPNGKYLLFSQSKSDSKDGHTDLWIIEKINDNWGGAKKLDSPINSINREANATMTSDGTIFFSSNRNCQNNKDCHTADLFYSKLLDEKYLTVQPVSEINSSNDEESVYISANEDYIIFCRYTNDETAVDLYISYRNINGSWNEPLKIDSSINSKDWERRPFVTIDNKFLFFTRLIINENELEESDVFWVNTSKLFKPFFYNTVADKTIQIGRKFELYLPNDYFKDIDDSQLNYKVELDQAPWLKFDEKNMKLFGVPTEEGSFEIAITAYDGNSNSTQDKININTKK